MIYYIKGKLTELTPTIAVIEAAGVGYEVNITVPTYSTLASKEQNAEEVKLYMREVVNTNDNTRALYGFSSTGERELFDALTSVGGVGPNTGRMIMSGYSAAEIRQIIATGNVKAMSSIKGIGPKTAQLIIVSLKDKVLKIDLGDNLGSVAAPEASVVMGGQLGETKNEAVAALSTLGFPAAAAGKAVDKLLKNDPTLTVGKLVKEALKML